MPIFKTKDDSGAIASSMIEVVRMHMLESKADSRAAIGVALTEVFYKAMLELFPEGWPGYPVSRHPSYHVNSRSTAKRGRGSSRGGIQK